MAARYLRLVSIWIHKGQEAAFDAFERGAVVRMAAHGGRIDAAVRTTPTGLATSVEDATPYEVHVVSFPDRAAAESYVNDPANKALQEKRATIIALTKALPGSEAGPY